MVTRVEVTVETTVIVANTEMNTALTMNIALARTATTDRLGAAVLKEAMIVLGSRPDSIVMSSNDKEERTTIATTKGVATLEINALPAQGEANHDKND